MGVTPWRWAVMEVKNDGRKNIGGGGVWHLAKGQHTQWDAWWMRAQRNRRSQMTFTAIKTFTWAPVWQQTDNHLPEFRDIREKRQKHECWAIQSRQMAFFWINVLFWCVCLVFCRFKLISVQQSQSHTFYQHTHTHIMILNPHGLQCKNDWAHFPIQPRNFLYIHTHESERQLNAEPARARSDKGIFLCVMSTFSLKVWGT